MRRVERFVEIDAPVERVFEAFSNFESFPEWMSGIGEVRRAGRHLTRWALAAARERRPLVWETETTVFQPDHRIAWRSVRGDVETDGEAIFEETRRQTTVLRLVLGYDLPHARSREGNDARPLFGRQFERVLEDDLQRFKRMVEQRAAGDGRRTMAGRGDERGLDRRGRTEQREPRWVAGAERRPPHSDERYYCERLHLRGRDDEGARERDRRSDTEEGRRVAGRPNYGDGESRRERDFDDALRAARQSQRESLRRYDEAHERDDGVRRQRPERERDKRVTADRLEAVRPRFRDERSDELDTHPPHRDSALTTRGTPEQASSHEYTLRRGIDHLLDDAPSGNWRR